MLAKGSSTMWMTIIGVQGHHYSSKNMSQDNTSWSSGYRSGSYGKHDVENHFDWCSNSNIDGQDPSVSWERWVPYSMRQMCMVHIKWFMPLTWNLIEQSKRPNNKEENKIYTAEERNQEQNLKWNTKRMNRDSKAQHIRKDMQDGLAIRERGGRHANMRTSATRRNSRDATKQHLQ